MTKTPLYAYCGIGITTEKLGEDRRVVIDLVRTHHRTPAIQAGLKRGDTLLAIYTPEGWREASALDIDKIQSLIRGVEDSPVTLQILTAGDLKERVVTMKRALIIQTPQWAEAMGPASIEVERNSGCGDLSWQLPGPTKFAAISPSQAGRW